jgi:hypothetical protein
MVSATPATASTGRRIPSEIRIVSHSNLLYWWPVWAVALLMGAISYMLPWYQYRLVPVPSGTQAGTLVGTANVKLMSDETTTKTVPEGTPVWYGPPDTSKDRVYQPGVTVSPYKGPGVIFAAVLLIVITITNIHMRGLWSLIVVVVIVAVVIIFALLGVWEFIFYYLRDFDIRISTGGYMTIGGVLLAIWLIVFFVFDPQRYIIFTPGSFRVRLEIGEGETAYDTRGMTVKKERSDFFRHWILGLGSGDLIVNTSGAHAHHFDLPNVLFLNRKLRIIEEMVRTHKEANA